jgi:amino acid adenylation domain-containing protein
VNKTKSRQPESGVHTDSHRCIPRMFEDQATIRPKAIAVSDGCDTLTYKELNDRADALAIHLRSIGTGPDMPVALCMRSSLSMIVGALGVLKAGGAYLPLDPEYPEQRLSYILKDAGVTTVLHTDTPVPPAPGQWTSLNIEAVPPSDGARTGKSGALRADFNDLAYVIYTSGSMGQPKGVEIEHHSLLNLVDWHQRTFRISEADRASQIAGVGFDAAVWEIWPYLTAGASIHIPSHSVRTQPEALRDWLVQQEITISFIPTALVERMMVLDWPRQTKLRTVLTGADRLHHFPPPSLPFDIVNNYGPTECTVVATSGVARPRKNADSDVPGIGRPITNTFIYILDANRRPVPAGTTGEIYIAGAGLARGYRNRPDLTSEKFTNDPFSTARGARMYKTGDLGRLMPDGQITFIGRADDQLKIRGYRVEPNEIVAALGQYPGICQAAVKALETPDGEKRLAAYIVANSGTTPDSEDISTFLRERLPEYMIPSAFIRLDRLPMTANGKLDREALPEPTTENTIPHGEYQAPGTTVEQQVSALLMELLEVERIGIHDNFFHLGGHSLLGAQMITRVRDVFDIELSLKSIFDHPTVEGISAEIERLILLKIDNATRSENIVAA